MARVAVEAQSEEVAELKAELKNMKKELAERSPEISTSPATRPSLATAAADGQVRELERENLDLRRKLEDLEDELALEKSAPASSAVASPDASLLLASLLGSGREIGQIVGSDLSLSRMGGVGLELPPPTGPYRGSVELEFRDDSGDLLSGTITLKTDGSGRWIAPPRESILASLEKGPLPDAPTSAPNPAPTQLISRAPETLKPEPEPTDPGKPPVDSSPGIKQVVPTDDGSVRSYEVDFDKLRRESGTP